MTEGFSAEPGLDGGTESATAVIWRTGRKVGRTIYAQSGPEPSDTDPLIGVMDTPELAAEACGARNAAVAAMRLAAGVNSGA